MGDNATRPHEQLPLCLCSSQSSRENNLQRDTGHRNMAPPAKPGLYSAVSGLARQCVETEHDNRSPNQKWLTLSDR